MAVDWYLSEAVQADGHYLDSYFLNLAGKASLVTTNANTFDNGRLIIEPHICGLIRRKNQRRWFT
jgi:hypothetical protein